MVKNRLLRSQANEIFLLLQKADLRLSEFRWGNRDTGNPSLTHESSGHYFRMKFGEYDAYYVDITFSPGDYQFEESGPAYNWQAVRASAEKWVTYLKRELQEPDFWETVAAEKNFIAGIGSITVEDPPFSPSEQERIRTSLEEIRIFLASTQELTEDQLKIVRERLDYLVDASSRMGRKDWVLFATGVFTSIIVTAAFTPTAAHEFLRFAGGALTWILEHRPLLIP
jgi:hypothetical protein